MNRAILVTGLGAMSPLGLGVREQAAPDVEWTFADVVTASTSGTARGAEHAVLSIPGEFAIADYVKPVGLRRKQRFSQIAMAAAVDAFADAGLGERPADLDRVGIVASTEYGPQRAVSDYLDGLIGAGLMEASPGLFTQTVYNVANGQASLALGLRGANSTLVGGSAIAYAALLLSSSKADAIFALTVDETNQIMSDYFDEALLDEADLAFPFRMGEAAAVVVLETKESALARRAAVLGELLGVGVASAPGAGLTYLDWDDDDDTIAYAMRAALDDAGLDISGIDLVVATSNGLGALTRSEFSAFSALGYTGPLVYPRFATGECFGGNEAMSYVLGIGRLAPGQTALVTVTTANGGVTSTVLRRSGE